MRTMRDIVSASVAPRRFQMVMVLLFATLALGLALVGVYGVTSYAVARQTKEIGVRSHWSPNARSSCGQCWRKGCDRLRPAFSLVCRPPLRRRPPCGVFSSGLGRWIPLLSARRQRRCSLRRR